MSEATSSRHGQRERKTRWNRARPTVEALEDRCLLSVNLVEVEPNNTAAQANVLQRVLDENVIVSGRVNSLGDRDWFKIELKQGDVIGAALNGQNGLNPAIRLVNADGVLMIGNDDSLKLGAIFLPPESPLPHKTSSDQGSQIYYVISAPGTYAIEVSASNDATTGKYSLDLVVARPAMEKQPVGAKQILFLDFDGATVNFSHFSEKHLPSGNRDVLPLAQSLPDWGLTAADEDAVIDAIVADVTRRLSTFVRSNGLNGDYDLTGIPGQFGIEIRNSRDHADEFGTNPLVSRVVIGLADEQFQSTNLGANAFVDVGNFKTNDEAVASVHAIEFLLQVVPIQSPKTVIDLIASVAGGIASHEAGHIFGCHHTEVLDSDSFAGITTLMDPDLSPTVGEDGVFGSADDRDLLFRADAYYHAEPFRGFNDTLNTVSFGLATGKKAALHATAAGGAVEAELLRSAQVELMIGPALARWQAAGVDTAALHGIEVRIADLGGTTLGLASGNTIWLDDNAAGWGWFVDPTPWEDSEFTTPGNQGEQGRMDLLTVLMHELGHVAGLDHVNNGVMQESLAAGTRLAANSGRDADNSRFAADALFALTANDEGPAWIASSLLGRGRQKR